MGRLSIELTAQQHRQIKTMAALKGQTIKQYVVERIFPSDALSEEELLAMKKLKSLLNERAERSKTKKGSGKTIEQLTADFLNDK